MNPEADLFKALADPTRLRLAVLLAIRGETCVCELAAALDEPEYKVSRHLAILRMKGLVAARRQGAWMHYRLVTGRTRLESCLQTCFREALNDHPTVIEDLDRLKTANCGKRSPCHD